MAEHNVGVRLSVIDGGKVKAELRGVGTEGAAAMRKIQDATAPASAGLRAINEVALDVRGRMTGISAAAGPLAAGLGALGVAGGVAAVGVGAVALALGKGTKDYAEAERVQKRLEAVLAATGYAAGVTGEQLDEFADAMEASTLASAEAVKEAAGVLATFRSVSGDTFLRTLGLAQDLASTFGGELSGAAVQLGKALEDPINGISALGRVGVTFSSSQKDVIKTLVETGDKAQAQKLILDVLAQQVGGAGSAEADSIVGAYKRASDAAGNFLEELVKTTGVAPGVRVVLEAIAGAINKVNAAVKGADISDRVAEVSGKLAKAQEDLVKAQEVAAETGLGVHQRMVTAAERRVEALAADLKRLQEETRTQEAETKKADDGRAAAQREAATDVALAKLAEYRKAIEGLATPEEKIRALNDGLAKTVESLNALRDKGADAKAVDEAIASATEATRRQIAEIEKPGQEAAQRASEQTRKLIDDLGLSIAMFGKSRDEFIQRYVERVGEGASAQELEQIRQLAGALYDKGEAEKATKKIAEDHNHAMEEGKRITEEMRTPLETYVARLADLDKALRAGAISQETYARATKQAREEMEKHATDAMSGLKRGLAEYGKEANDSAKQVEEAVKSTFKGVEDAIVEAVTTGKLEWKDLVDSILADLARLLVRQTITGPISSALGSAVGTVSTSIFHSGGQVGASAAETRDLPAALWAGAPRAHTGARLLRPGEVPIIAELGERVLNRQETRAYESGDWMRRVREERASAARDVLAMTINVEGARGNAEIQAMVEEGIAKALDAYDRGRARRTAVEAVEDARARTSIVRLR